MAYRSPPAGLTGRNALVTCILHKVILSYTGDLLCAQFVGLWGALVAFIALVGAAIAAEPVDLLLVLASDVSHSIDTAKFKLQRDGYIAALSDPRVIEVIRSGPHGRIAICFVEWSGGEEQRVVIDWTLIDGTKAAQDLVSQLDEAPRSFANFTSISAGIDFAIAQLKRAPYHSIRQTIDVSGDGTNNSGRSVIAARDDAVAQGVTINGLVILSEQPLEQDPYHTHPVGGLERPSPRQRRRRTKLVRDSGGNLRHIRQGDAQ